MQLLDLKQHSLEGFPQYVIPLDEENPLERDEKESVWRGPQVAKNKWNSEYKLKNKNQEMWRKE